MTIDLKEYKDQLKSKVIVGELTSVVQILDFTIKFLDLYNYYAPVKDIVIQLKDTKTILDIHLNNHKNKIKEGTSENKAD